MTVERITIWVAFFVTVGFWLLVIALCRFTIALDGWTLRHTTDSRQGTLDSSAVPIIPIIRTPFSETGD